LNGTTQARCAVDSGHCDRAGLEQDLEPLAHTVDVVAFGRVAICISGSERALNGRFRTTN
jgi:hypothetical protein